MTTKHTPGPWKFAAAVQNNGPNYFVISTGKWCEPAIATCESEANAKLIAAAPETAAERDRLRAALENCHPALVLLGNYIGNEWQGGGGIDAFDRCAILKALHDALDNTSPAPAESVNKELLRSAKLVYGGLIARIDAAPSTEKPVFAGIADLHDAIAKAEKAGG